MLFFENSNCSKYIYGSKLVKVFCNCLVHATNIKNIYQIKVKYKYNMDPYSGIGPRKQSDMERFQVFLSGIELSCISNLV